MRKKQPVQLKPKLIFELIGLLKTIEIGDVELLTSMKGQDATNALFNIIQSYLNQRYEIQAIRRKHIPIFLFKGSDFSSAFQFSQKIKKDNKDEVEGRNGAPFYFLVYLSPV